MPDNAARITEGLEHFAYCLNKHTERSGYGGGFNYEDFAQSQFKLKGRGFIFFDATNFVASFLEGQVRCVEVKHKYVLLEKLKKLEYHDFAGLQAISQYDESRQYAAFIVATTKRLPPIYTAGVELDMFFAGQINFVQAPTSSTITTIQIRKRLNRMVAAGVRLITIDTSEPEFAGSNLKKWLSEIKSLERRGKNLSVIVNSDQESAALIPDDVKSDLLTLVSR